ncbi:hypothetical protein BGZ96_009552 [Linnemannia gamsii]|uniref:PHD-type domain-containing protein n=1 Tax=Linnemannia gamsii TaxID=64522 RepID=A0ABQ7JWU1_9FUNG|nr:hypothetical protein BGZ96_009552 [Linnemannia gamsii]
MDRSRSHSISAQQQQQQQHYNYVAQSAPQVQQPQHALLSPPPRGSMQDIHPGAARNSVPAQHQQPIQAHHSQERPQPENDEAAVLTFLSELQMQGQQHPQQQSQHQLQHSQAQGPPVHKQVRKAASSPQVPQTGPQMPSQQMYSQHPQHQYVPHPQPHHTPAIQQQQQQQQQQPMHMDHSPLLPSHGRYVHGDHHGYPPSHEPLPTSPVYHPQPSSVAPPAVELPRPMTPPGLVSPGVHPRSQGPPMADTRQRPIPGSGLGPGSENHMVAPHSGMQPLDPIKTAHAPGTPTGSAPPRSASLMNILNVPERVSHIRHAQVEDRDDMEDVQPTSAHVPHDRAPVDPTIRQVYRHDAGQRADYPPAFSEAPRDAHYEERFVEPERPTQVTPAEQDSVEEHASAVVVAPKSGKEKTARPVKEKVAKEKPVKSVKEKVEKVKKERVPKGGKKKLSTSATIGIESDEPGMDTVIEYDQLPAEARPQDSRPQEARPQDLRPQDARPQEFRLQESRPQEARPQEARPQESRPQESHTQEYRPQEYRLQDLRHQEPHLQEPRPLEPHPQGSRPQEPQLQESVGVFKHTLELPGGGRIELPSKKPRTDSFTAPAPEVDGQAKVPRGSEGRRPQDISDKAPVKRDPIQTQPIELPKPAPTPTKDSPSSSRNTPAKFISSQQPFPVSLPPTESSKASRMNDVSPREPSTTKASSAHVRSGSSSPLPMPSSLRGHTGLGVELPEPHPANGSSTSAKKSQQDGDRDRERDRDRPKATTSKDASKSSKASTGGSYTPKEKKPSKKDIVVDKIQDDEIAVVTPKASKSHDTSKKSQDNDEDMPSPKLPSKFQSTSKKSSSSAQSQSSSLKKRFSRTTGSEDGHLGSTGSKAQETQDSTPSHDRTTSSEGSRGKPSKSHSSVKVEAEQLVTKAQKSSSSSSNQVAAREEDVVMAEPDRGEGLYCICRTAYDESRFMIACDGCDDWFHGDCVGVAEKDSVMVDKYYCKRCEDKGRHGSLKKKCFREGCQKPAGRKSKYCSKECGLLVATQRIQESQEKVFGESNQTELPPGQVQQQQHLQRRRRLTLADLDDRQRLLGIREKMAHARKVCAILEERAMQLDICVDRQARQDLGPLDLSTVAGLNAPSSSPQTGTNGESKSTATTGGDMEDEDEGVLRSGSASKSKVSKAKALKDKAAAKEKDKDALCGFDYSLVWDDAQDIARKDRAALNSLVSTPVGSRASSVAPPSFGVVVVAPKKQQQNGTESSNDNKSKTEGGAHDGESGGGVQTPSASGEVGSNTTTVLAFSPYLQAIGRRVCTSRRSCDRHIGWQKLKAAERELEQTLQNKLLRTLKAEAKLVKSRMKRRRNDLSARILNGTIEH